MNSNLELECFPESYILIPGSHLLTPNNNYLRATLKSPQGIVNKPGYVRKFK